MYVQIWLRLAALVLCPEPEANFLMACSMSGEWSGKNAGGINSQEDDPRSLYAHAFLPVLYAALPKGV